MSVDFPKMQQIFLSAVEDRQPEDWDAYLAQACAGDNELRNQVKLLLKAHLEAGSVPVAATGRQDKTVAYQSAAETAGATIGPYKLLQLIGEGGMGTVFMAEQSQPVQRKVALKIIKPGMDSRQVVARFEAERQALALMDHPHIAKVLDAGTTTSGRPFFVMELVKGVPITRYCDERRLAPQQRLELFVSVCQAVQHAHQKGVIHRDLKPSNVLVAEYDDKAVAKVIDFGVAKATGSRLTERTVFTEVGQIVGTLEYMSPEQAKLNALDIDTRSDIYALGVMLYELLTGTTPLQKQRFRQAAFDEMLRIIREEEPPRPSTRLSTTDELPSIAANRSLEPKKLSGLVRGELDWIVMKALEKDRNRRYETANGFALDIQRYLADEPVQACPPSAAYRLRKFARRNKAAFAAGSVVATALVITVAGLAVSNAMVRRQSDAKEAALQGKTKALGEKEKALESARFQENLAKQNAATAEIQTGLANERAEDLARRLYIHRVNLGYREVLANNVAQADALLDACEPARRGWEWALSKRLCHLETMTLGGFADHAAGVAGARRGLTAPGTSDHEGDAVVGIVRGVACSPNGRQVAAAHDDGTVGIYDARTGRELRSLAGHDGYVSCVTFDADGGRVISGGYDRTIRVWDANTGEQKLILRGHTRPIWSVAFRPGTDELAASAWGPLEDFLGRGFEIKQWDLAQGREIRTLHHGHGWEYTSVAFSPDGRRLLSSSIWGGFLRIWDPDTGKQLEERPIPENSRGLAVSPADGRIAFGGAGNLLFISSPEMGPAMRACSGHTTLVVGVAFSRDGARVAAGAEDGTIRIWNVADGSAYTLLRGHTAGVNSVAFHDDGGSLVSGSDDGTVKAWDVPLAPDPYPIYVGAWAWTVAFSPDGRRMGLVFFHTNTVVDSTSARTIFPLSPFGERLTYSRDGRFIAAGGGDSDRARIWDAESGRPVATCQGPTGRVRGLAFGPGNRLAVAAEDGAVYFYDASGGPATSVIRAGEAGAFGMAFDPDRTTLATIGRDGAVRLWDGATGRPIRQLGGTSGRLSVHTTDSLTFDPEGRRLAAARGDGTVAVWEIATGTEVFRLRGHTRPINAVVYSRDGRRIATASEDFTIKLWDAANGDEVFTLRGHSGFVLGLAFSPDGNRLLSASADGTYREWNATPPAGAVLDSQLKSGR